MVDKTKRSPLPETQRPTPATKDAQTKRSEPQFIRGTIDPTTKKER